MSKKKANGEGTIRQRSNGTWEGRLTIDGERKSFYAKSKTELRKKLTDIQSQVDTSSFIDESDLTLSQWVKTWEEDCLQGVTQSTRSKYERDMRNYILPVIGKVRIRDLRPDIIRKVYRSMEKKGLSEKTIKNAHGTLHTALEQAVTDELIKTNVCDKVKPPKQDKPKVVMRPLIDDEVKRFLQEIQGNRFESLYFVALFTGMRESELIGLTWDCVDFDRQTIHLYRQLKREEKKVGVYVFTKIKKKKERTFAPPSQVFDILKKVKRQQTEWKLKYGLSSSWKNKDNLVFTYEDGSNVSTRTVYNNFKAIVSRMGIKEVRFHDLRHTFATLALQNGVDVKTVSSILGHSTVAFTMDKYTHISNIMMKNGAEKMGAYINAL